MLALTEQAMTAETEPYCPGNQTLKQRYDMLNFASLSAILSETGCKRNCELHVHSAKLFGDVQGSSIEVG